MRIGRKRKTALFLVIFSLTSCGWSFGEKYVTLDTEKNILYQNSSVDAIVAAFDQNPDTAKEKYGDNYFRIVGKIKEISKNGKSVVLDGVNDNEKMLIECSADEKLVKETITNLNCNDIVNVYGKIKVSVLSKDVSVKISQIEKTDQMSVDETMYSYYSGKTYNIADMEKRILADGKVNYYVPKKWAEIELDIVKNELGILEGYQYVLNEGSNGAAENFFICYFHYKDMLDDRSQMSNKKGIRKAIIDNILDPKEDKDITKIQTYYGAEYYYYDDSYKNKVDEDYRVEFVFYDVDQEGMLVYLYVYQDENHVDDILGVMRCLSIDT